MPKKRIKTPQHIAVDTVAGRVFLSWEAPEYEYYQKGTDWYWWVGLFAISFFGIAIWQRSFLFGVFVLLAWFTIVLYAVRPPQNFTIKIAERGILIGQKLYLWQNLKSFWIFYNPPFHKELVISSNKTLMPTIKINLGNTDPQALRSLLLSFLSEIEQEESLFDNLSRLARF